MSTLVFDMNAFTPAQMIGICSHLVHHEAYTLYEQAGTNLQSVLAAVVGRTSIITELMMGPIEEKEDLIKKLRFSERALHLDEDFVDSSNSMHRRVVHVQTWARDLWNVLRQDANEDARVVDLKRIGHKWVPTWGPAWGTLLLHYGIGRALRYHAMIYQDAHPLTTMTITARLNAIVLHWWPLRAGAALWEMDVRRAVVALEKIDKNEAANDLLERAYVLRGYTGTDFIWPSRGFAAQVDGRPTV